MLPNQISLKPSSIACVLGTVAFLLVLAHAGTQLAFYLIDHENISGLVTLFNLDKEKNIPTFFSTFLLLFAALLLGVITILKRNQTASYVSHWALLSFGFFFMAADEASGLHEKFIRPTRELLGDGNLGVFYFTWVIPAIALVLVLALFFLRFLLHLPPKTRRSFLIAATIYLGGAIGFELIGGRIVELHGQILPYKIVVTVEESLEMTGIIIFIWTLLVFIAENYKEVRFCFDPVREDITLDSPKV